MRKLILGITASLISLTASANVVDVTKCVSTMNSTRSELNIVIPLTPFKLNGTYTSSSSSSYGESFSTSVEVKDGNITKIMIGYSDGEGGQNKQIDLNDKVGELRFYDGLGIRCEVH
ncbi:MAG: hypothetical protein CME64_06105 [Halobacteriovoraceae bacterium]|nr:hypothetical protein [Halobacteriovoraceae bacterium]